MLKKYALEVLNDAAHHLSSSSVSELLASDAINGCECCLIEGAMSWAKRECEDRGLEVTIPNQRLVLESCNAWQQLRFLTLSPQQFNRICSTDGLLSAEEIAFIKVLWLYFIFKAFVLISIKSFNLKFPFIFLIPGLLIIQQKQGWDERDTMC